MSAQHPQRTGSFQERDLGDEYLLYDQHGDRLHVLNGTAREIYLLCDGQRTVEQIAEAFAEIHGEQAASARQDALETLDQLLELGLVRQP